MFILSKNYSDPHSFVFLLCISAVSCGETKLDDRKAFALRLFYHSYKSVSTVTSFVRLLHNKQKLCCSLKKRLMAGKSGYRLLSDGLSPAFRGGDINFIRRYKRYNQEQYSTASISIRFCKLFEPEYSIFYKAAWSQPEFLIIPVISRKVRLFHKTLRHLSIYPVPELPPFTVVIPYR